MSPRISNGKTKKYSSRELNRLDRKLSRLERPKPTKKPIVKNKHVYAYYKHDQIVTNYHVVYDSPNGRDFDFLENLEKSIRLEIL